MRALWHTALFTMMMTALRGTAAAQGSAPAALPPISPTPAASVTTLTARLDLERYKATIKGLTQFGDRRQGTERNRRAVDWIEAQLKSYGCPTERLRYAHDPPPPRTGQVPAARPAEPAIPRAVGGGRPRGIRTPTGVNTDPMKQPNERLRTLNREPAVNGPREEVYCTKVGTRYPNEMYIVSAHMDGHGWGEAANDDGSGTALVMELARIFSMPDVQTERTIRFALWNNEETGLNGAGAYVEQRKGLQGQENPAGSGRYPEPTMARHDPARHDAVRSRHAARRRHHPAGTAPGSRREHRVPDDGTADAWRAGARLVPARGQREVRNRLSGAGRSAHDQHRLDAVHGPGAGRSACARTSAAYTSAVAGIHSGISRPTCSRPTRTRIFAWA